MPAVPNSHGCFVCGDQNPAGLHARFQTDGATISTEITLSPPHNGYNGIAHGGVLAALLDEAMGWAPAVATGRLCMAVEIHVRYRQSVPIGTPLVVKGWVTDTSKRIWEGAGEIRGLDGILYVEASGRFVPLPDEAGRAVADYLVWAADCVPREELLARKGR